MIFTDISDPLATGKKSEGLAIVIVCNPFGTIAI